MNIPQNIIEIINQSCKERGVNMADIDKSDTTYTMMTEQGILDQMESIKKSGHSVGKIFYIECTPGSFEVKSQAVEV